MKKSSSIIRMVIPTLVQVYTKHNRIHPSCDIYIGRGTNSKWNNIYSFSLLKTTDEGSKNLSVKDKKIMENLSDISEQTIGCFCDRDCKKTENCNGNIILEAFKNNIMDIE